MPGFLQRIGSILPSTYLTDGLLKTTVQSGGIAALGNHFLIMTIWLVVFFVLSIIFFKWE